MANFYIEKTDITENIAAITGEEAQHISRVLRMKKGDEVTLCDGEGMFYEAVLSDFSDKTVTAEILSSRRAETEPHVQVTIFQGVPKNPKLETIIQKLTEIGAVRLVPVDTKRCVAKLDKENKVDRLRKIAREAAKQSKRGIVPEVLSPVNFKEAVSMAAEADLALIPYEEEREMSLKKALSHRRGHNALYGHGRRYRSTRLNPNRRLDRRRERHCRRLYRLWRIRLRRRWHLRIRRIIFGNPNSKTLQFERCNMILVHQLAQLLFTSAQPFLCIEYCNRKPDDKGAQN